MSKASPRASYEVGHLVEAIKFNNGLRAYHPARVTAVHKKLYVSNTHVYAEKVIAFYVIARIISLGLLFRRDRLYDLEYEDGSVEKRVAADRIRDLQCSSSTSRDALAWAYG